MSSIKYHDKEVISRPLDAEEFRAQAHKVVDFIADYYKNVEQFPVLSQVDPGYLRKAIPEGSAAPNAPSHWNPFFKISADMSFRVSLTGNTLANFYAYVSASNSIAALLGEMLSAGFNVIGFNWLSSPAVTELDMLVVDWFGEMLKLPKSFLVSGGHGGGGVFQGTTCGAILCTLVAARDQKLEQIGRDKFTKLLVYSSDQTHMCLQKAAQVEGW